MIQPYVGMTSHELNLIAPVLIANNPIALLYPIHRINWVAVNQHLKLKNIFVLDAV